MDVYTNEAGYLVVNAGAPRQFVAIGPDRFGARYDTEELFFHRDANGAVTHLSFSGFAANSAERLSTLQAPGTHRVLFGLLATLTLVVALGLPLRAATLHFGGGAAGGLGRWLQVALWVPAAAILASLVNLATSLMDPSRFYFEIPGDVLVLLALMPLVALLALASSLVATRTTFLDVTVQVTLGERVLVLASVVASVLYVFLGFYWNLLTHYL